MHDRDDDDFGFVTLEQAMRAMCDSIRKIHEMEAEEKKEAARARSTSAAKFREETLQERSLDGAMRTPGEMVSTGPGTTASSDGAGASPYPLLATTVPTQSGGIREERTGRANASGELAAAEFGCAAAAYHAAPPERFAKPMR
jgi:hypothetical protein